MSSTVAQDARQTFSQLRGVRLAFYALPKKKSTSEVHEITRTILLLIQITGNTNYTQLLLQADSILSIFID